MEIHFPLCERNQINFLIEKFSILFLWDRGRVIFFLVQCDTVHFFFPEGMDPFYYKVPYHLADTLGYRE